MYEPVPSFPDLPALERRVLAFWQKERVFARLRAKNAGGPRWSFLDGPITANNPMGVHHAWGRSLKDMFQRYHAMCGRELRYQNGFDCQGLWVEVEVEKENGFATKADIAAYGIDRFVRDCKARVLEFAAKQTEQSIRLGYWMDWDDPATLREIGRALLAGEERIAVRLPSGAEAAASPEAILGGLGNPRWGGSYYTLSNENNYTIWAFLKRCHAEGKIYRGTDVMPWCCRCGTGLSQMEVAEGRQITKHPALFVRFPLRDRERHALLVWTTTPWTLTSNVAAAVHPGLPYLELRHGGWTYYAGKENYTRERAQELEAGGKKSVQKFPSLARILAALGPVEVVRELPGAELVGRCYRGPFDHLPAQTRPAEEAHGRSAVDCHRVIPWTEVSGVEGTGIVHIAPGCGAEDLLLGREHDLAAIAPLDDGGVYREGFGALSGRPVLDVNEEIVADLKARDLLVARESYPHVYPHCWRCKEELVFRLVDEWFIRMDWRDRIQRIVPEITWIPADGEARELDWLNNMGDWMISKKRFWGLALPIWTCPACGAFDVIGGEGELRERAVAGWDQFAGHAPHRPWIDRVEIACACGARMRRIEDVGNPWLDAGIVPFSTVHYNVDRAYWEKWFPADFVVECFPGQFRNWFYALLAMSAMLEGRAPFRVLLGHASVRDARGDEMHKSKGNAIAFDEAAEVLGAEVMRYIFARQNPVQNLNFPDLPREADARGGKVGIDGEVRGRLMRLWNCYSFFVTYATVDRWSPRTCTPVEPARRGELDRWVLSRLQHLIESAHLAFGDHAIHRFMDRLEHFTDELSTWYLRRSRRRFWTEGIDADKEAAYQTLYEALATVTRLLAPVLPFLTEEIHRNLVRGVDPGAPTSVHLESYPVADRSLMDEDLERAVDCVIRAKNLCLQLRAAANVKTRQPLGTLYVRPRDAADRAVLADRHFAVQILEECNVKSLALIEDETAFLTVQARPRFEALKQRAGPRTGAVAAALAAADPHAVRRALAEGAFSLDLEGEPFALGPGDVELRYGGPDHLVFAEERGMFALLDTTITPELEAEGVARDFNRQAQDRRKAEGLVVTDRIEVVYVAADRIASALARHDEWLRGELLADAIRRVADLPDAPVVKVGGEPVRLAVTRAGA
ncbi:MAG: class I tRNA ligase family protein [Planctomycetota bacterium]